MANTAKRKRSLLFYHRSQLSLIFVLGMILLECLLFSKASAFLIRKQEKKENGTLSSTSTSAPHRPYSVPASSLNPHCKQLMQIGNENFCVCAPFEKSFGPGSATLNKLELYCNGKPRYGFISLCKTCRCTRPPSETHPKLSKEKLSCNEILPGFCGPKFIIAGADKCGTNALYAHIAHAVPGIFYNIPLQGRQLSCETRQFTGEVNWRWSTRPLTDNAARKEYSKYFFRTDWKTSIAFDKSTTYFGMDEIGIKNMHAALPDAKVLALICDPIKRLWSRMNQNNKIDIESACLLYRDGWDEHVVRQAELMVNKFKVSSAFDVEECEELLSFYGKVGGHIERLKKLSCSICRTIVPSLYSSVIRSWFQVYGRSNFMVVKTTDLQEQPVAVTKAVLDFLALTPRRSVEGLGAVHSSDKDNVVHYIDSKNSSSFQKLKSILKPFYLSELEALESLLPELSFDDWRASFD